MHQNIIIRRVIVLVPVMQIHSAHRTRKERIGKLFSKKFQSGIHRTILAERVHLHADFSPLVVIADCRVALALGARARHGIFAGTAVADRASLTVRTKTGPCIL